MLSWAVAALIMLIVVPAQAVDEQVTVNAKKLVGKWLRQARAQGSQVGVEVRALSTGQPMLSLNADEPLNPASSIKILTTYAALLQLGDRYRWRTRFFLDGPLQAGTLDGDLVLAGGGDPKLVIEDLVAAMQSMQALGLTRIKGNLRLNNSLYAPPALQREVFDGQPTEPYNVWPDAAMLNFKSTKFVVSVAKREARLTFDPALAGVQVENQIKLIKGRCRYAANGLKIRERVGPSGPVLRVSGRYSRSCGQTEAFHAVLDHVRFSDALFRDAWQQLGGQWSGRAVRDTEKLDDTRQPWFVWVSPRTLADVITDINKFSNNVMTRQLMLQLAAEGREPTISEAAARRVVTTTLKLNGLALPGLIVDNGSGLSRRARVTAGGLNDVLSHAALSDYEVTFRESLPVVAVDGTMRRRLRSHPVAGQAWIKTGSLAGVRSMAGYVYSSTGNWYAATMIINGKGARKTRSVQDELIKWVFENG